MNNQRRKEINAVLEELSALRSRIETIQSEEQDAYDAKTVGDKRTTTPAINEANARLIASAPDLLAALEEVTAELSQLHSHYHPACEGGCPTVEYIMNARKAILKANGG